MEWNENDHPRAKDGKWTNGQGGNTQPKKFKQNTNYDDILAQDEPLSFGKEIDDKIKEREPLSDTDIETVFAQISKVYERPEKGYGDKNLKKILDLNGFSDKPKKVNKNELASILASGTVMYRGLNGEDAVRYAKQFYDGEMYVGIGLGGNGVYMSKDSKIAEGYTLGSNVTVVAVMPKDMKIAGNDVRKDYREFSARFRSTAEQTQEEKEHVWGIQKALSFGVYCALKGYDAFLPTVKPETNIVVMNRSKLIIGENNEQEGILEHN